MADKNFKKDPDVIAHVEAAVAKDRGATLKAERARLTAFVNEQLAIAKTESNTQLRSHLTVTLKGVIAVIKNPS